MRATCCLVLATLVCLPLAAAQPPAAGPDTIVFANGDKLVGHFVRSSGSTITFKSDILGDITVDWVKVKELHTAQKVAVIRKDVKLGRHPDTASIPQGTLSMENQNLQLAAPPQPPQSIPVTESNLVIDQPAFEKAVTHHPGFLADWAGTVTLGATIIQATQDNRTFNGAISLVRAEPSESWLAPRDRTSLDFSTSYGELSQPNTPTIKTSIYHADAERDEYFVDSIFAFGQAAFDHNFSQGLDLQQSYGGGIGWTAIQTSNQTLDLKGSITYIRQHFTTPPDYNLIGSSFAEHYKRGFKHGLVLDQHLSVTPAWNELHAYSAYFDTLLTLPVYRRLSASTGFIDTFLNDPPPGFKKNSLQYTLGLTYTLR
ncbi:MAG TPA: DUF481 domain-containing protein [Bryobacteraceae bacterium]|nr:DUF481 domain-containing protein [Bryobacteraceae bacterium]